MPFFEYIIRLYAPFSCVGCAEESDTLLCSSCSSALSMVPSRCYKCKATARESRTCQACRKKSSLYSVYVVTHYTEVPKELLKVTKYSRAQGGTVPIAQVMAPLLGLVPAGAVLVPVPTATGRVRMRGYDQAVLIAKQLARETGLGYVRGLARIGQAHQVGSNRAERLRHLDGAFRVVRPKDCAGKHILLVDDVITTGATLETAAKILKQAGAKQVDAIVFAQA